MDIEYVISFTGTSQGNADDQMVLSSALATAVGTLETVSSTFIDEQPFEVYWKQGYIEFESGTLIVRFTQPEALRQAASLRQAALDAGATVL